MAKAKVKHKKEKDKLPKSVRKLLELVADDNLRQLAGNEPDTLEEGSVLKDRFTRALHKVIKQANKVAAEFAGPTDEY